VPRHFSQPALSMLAPQPGLDCCTTASPCSSASSHATTLFTWSGNGLSPAPSVVLYALSATSEPTLLVPLPHRKPLILSASAESVAAVISGGAQHSWIIQSGGDVLSSGMFFKCPSAGSIFTDVPCSAGDAVAVLPLPIGWSRRVPIALHVSVTLDYANSAGLADFGVADDDDDEDLGHDAADTGHVSDANRPDHPLVEHGLQLERVGNGPASALQVSRVEVTSCICQFALNITANLTTSSLSSSCSL
jgi:hypothetical protein